MNLYLDREARYYYIRRWKKLSLPTTDGNNMLDKSWLENLILDEEKIRRVDKCLDMVEEPLSKKNKNFMSDISRLRMRVKLGSGVLSELLLVAKKIPESTSMQEFHKEFKMADGEIVGYHILDMMERLMKDRQDYRENLWCQLKGHTGSTLVFEDLTSKGYEPCGDILFDEERSKFVLRELARYHAMGMALVEGKMVDRKSIRPLFLCEENSKEVFLNSCITSLRDAVANWGPDWSESLKQLKQISDNLERVCQKMAHVIRTTLNVISHGDSWKGNMLFKHDLLGQILSMKFVDFQILSYCSYIYDLIIFLYSSIDHELRWTKLHDLLQYYRENLIANMKFYNLDSTKVPSLNEMKETLEFLRPFVIILMAVYWPANANEGKDDELKFSSSFEKEEASKRGSYKSEFFQSDKTKQVLGREIREMLGRNVLG